MWCESLLHSQPKAPCLVIPHSSCATSAVTGRYACHWGQHYRDGNLCSINRKHGTQYLLSFDMVSRWEIQEKNGKVKIPTPKKKTKPKNPTLWLIINVKCQSLKLCFFHVPGCRRVRCPRRIDFIFYFWVWRSWMWFGKFIKILWWSWVELPSGNDAYRDVRKLEEKTADAGRRISSAHEWG